MSASTSTMAAPELDIPVLGRIDRESLLDTCRRGHHQARRSQNRVLVSWAKPLTLSDPVEVWSRARRSVSRSFLWQSAWDDGSVLAFGTAHDLRGSGEDRIRAVRDGWVALSRDLVTGGSADASLPSGDGPLAIGGFAFVAGGAVDESRLPDALIWVPAVQFRSRAPHPAAPDSSAPAELRLNATLTSDSDPEQVAKELAHLADLCLIGDADDAWRVPRQLSGRQHTHAEPVPASAWKELVRRATDRIRAGEFDKVVLARELRITASAPFDVPAAVRRLRDASSHTTLFVVDHEGRTFLGASPEYLVRVGDRTVHALGLAGTMPRGATPEQDRALEQKLTDCEKNQREHHIVVRMLDDALRGSCVDVTVETPPTVVKLANVQHLSTKVHGLLPVDSSAGVLDFVDTLHPTPALGGHPRAEALGWLAANEGLDRSWYAGAVGWADHAGDGQFAVAIRCALLDGPTASLYAGCGLVADSDPEAEYAETRAKLRVMLSALEIE